MNWTSKNHLCALCHPRARFTALVQPNCLWLSLLLDKTCYCWPQIYGPNNLPCTWPTPERSLASHDSPRSSGKVAHSPNYEKICHYQNNFTSLSQVWEHMLSGSKLRTSYMEAYTLQRSYSSCLQVTFLITIRCAKRNSLNKELTCCRSVSSWEWRSLSWRWGVSK